jgi:hypothetical protein
MCEDHWAHRLAHWCREGSKYTSLTLQHDKTKLTTVRHPEFDVWPLLSILTTYVTKIVLHFCLSPLSLHTISIDPEMQIQPERNSYTRKGTKMEDDVQDDECSWHEGEKREHFYKQCSIWVEKKL